MCCAKSWVEFLATYRSCYTRHQSSRLRLRFLRKFKQLLVLCQESSLKKYRHRNMMTIVPWTINDNIIRSDAYERKKTLTIWNNIDDAFVTVLWLHYLYCRNIGHWCWNCLKCHLVQSTIPYQLSFFSFTVVMRKQCLFRLGDCFKIATKMILPTLISVQI